MPQEIFNRLQPALNALCQLGHGMHAPKNVLHGHCHGAPDNHGKAQPQRILGTLVDREVGFIPQRNSSRKGKAEANSRGVIRHNVDQVKRQQERKRDP